MADKNSATPDIKDTSKALPTADMDADAHLDADSQAVPVYTPADDTADTEEHPSPTQEQFAKARDAQVTEKQEEEKPAADTASSKFENAVSGNNTFTRETSPEGFYIEDITDENGKKKQGVKVHHGLPQMSMGDAFGKLMFLLAIFLKDPEMFPAWKEALYPKDTYTDPVERQQRITSLKNVAVNKDHQDRKLPAKEFATKHFSEKHLGSLKSIAPQLNEMVDIILQTESKGGDPNIIWDSRSRFGEKTDGLQPGEFTRGGLKVPDITKLTVNEVLAWQRDYINEQKAQGLTLDKRSSAAGAYQFIYTTLKEMRDDGLIDGNRTFDFAAQTELMSNRAQWRINRAIKASNGTVQSLQKELEREFKSEWEGLQGIGDNDKAKEIRQAVKRITEEMAHNMLNDEPDNVQVAQGPKTPAEGPQA